MKELEAFSTHLNNTDDYVNFKMSFEVDYKNM